MLLWLVVGLGVVCASSCALLGPAQVFHSVSIENFGSTSVRKVVVQYGAERLDFQARYPPRGMATEAGEMAVPAQLTVQWETEAGQVRSETLPIELKGIPPRRLFNVRVRFTDGGIELYQGVSYSSGGREYTRIHPK